KLYVDAGLDFFEGGGKDPNTDRKRFTLGAMTVSNNPHLWLTPRYIDGQEIPLLKYATPLRNYGKFIEYRDVETQESKYEFATFLLTPRFSIDYHRYQNLFLYTYGCTIEDAASENQPNWREYLWEE
ncbi:MAG: hypothetical protein M1823_006111, partial [Watsoniomyces obsoletus]